MWELNGPNSVGERLHAGAVLKSTPLLYPNITMKEHVVTLTQYLNYGATFLFSITGAVFAIRRHYDWVGLFTLALCSGVGGALLRDGLFIQDGPPAAMRNPGYLWAVIAGCMAGGLFHRSVDKLDRLFLYADALGLGAYGVVGFTKAFHSGLSLVAAIFVGVVNATGGSIVRDVLTGSEPLVFKPGQFYVLAALLGVCAHAAAISWDLPTLVGACFAIVLTFAARALSISFNWKTGPILPPPTPSSEA